MPAKTNTNTNTNTNTQKVRYTGTSDVREISSGGKTVRWDAGNSKVVDLAELSFLSDDDFNRIITNDGSFKVEG